MSGRGAAIDASANGARHRPVWPLHLRNVSRGTI